MTYVIGWKNKRATFLCADSAATNAPKGTATPKTSFGETDIRDEKRAVEERLFKLSGMNDKVIAAYAGSVHHATQSLQLFKNLLPSGVIKAEEIRRCLHDAIISHGPYADEAKFCIMAGFVDDQRVPHLIVASTSNPLGEEAPTHAWAGSLDPLFHQRTVAFIANLVACQDEKGLSDDQLIVMVTAYIQSYGIFDPLLPQGVGGTFFGVLIDDAGIRWHGDAVYLVHDIDTADFTLIEVRYLDGILCIKSEFTKETRMYMNSTTHKPEAVTKEYLDSFKGVFDRVKADCCIFLSKRNRNITVVKTDGHLKTNRILIDDADPKKIHTYLSAEIKEAVEKASNGEILFNWFDSTPISDLPSGAKIINLEPSQNKGL